MSIAGSLGCATMAASAIVSGDGDFYSRPVITDEIVAIGRPDTVLAKEIGQTNVVAFIGLKNTYLLHKGGDELERISHLKLDGKRMDIDAARSYRLYMKGRQVWGEMILTYGGGAFVSAEEQAELESAGFTALKGVRNNLYQKKVGIEGVIYPAIKLSEEQMSKLTTHRTFNLYNSKDAKPPILGKILKAPLIVAGVAADIILLPVYLGVGAVVLISVVVSH